MLGVGDKVRVDYPHLINPAGEAKLTRTFLTADTYWTAPQVLDTGEAGKPVLLLLRDSFSNEMLPLLYPHFSRIVLAHDQDGTWRPDLVDRFKPDLVIGETVEHGLRVGMQGGPPPSAQAIARIDRALAAMRRPGELPAGAILLAPPDQAQAAAIAAAQPTTACNIEVARLSPGANGEATFEVAGWLSELGRQVTSPQGLVGLRGPGGLLVAPIAMDRPRPDVAAFFKNPAGEASGFAGSFFIRRLPPGGYTPVAWRRAAGGWIACNTRQPVVMP